MASELSGSSGGVESRLDMLVALVEKHEQQLQLILAQLENVHTSNALTPHILRQDTRDLDHSFFQGAEFHEKRNKPLSPHWEKDRPVYPPS
jgi:uncharacterized protein YejL (UPF0352 family)